MVSSIMKSSENYKNVASVDKMLVLQKLLVEIYFMMVISAFTVRIAGDATVITNNESRTRDI
jgi:hypothetical protein